ncbi:hypothetical protein V6O07_20020, partial [Arthrospira platensis SPKY2]
MLTQRKRPLTITVIGLGQQSTVKSQQSKVKSQESTDNFIYLFVICKPKHLIVLTTVIFQFHHGHFFISPRSFFQFTTV